MKEERSGEVVNENECISRKEWENGKPNLAS
jgi:hypothetical protein